MSSPDLSACQTAEKKVIRHDMLDRTLAAPQQKFRLLASAEPKGNEYGRNYFDPLMDEEINPRQCAMEVSREGDDRIFYNQLTKHFDESGQEKPQDESGGEETLNSEAPGSSSKNHKIHKEASEATPDYLEEFQRYAEKNMILLRSSPLEQDLKFEGEGLNQYIPMSLLKTGRTFENRTPSPPFIADLNICKKDSAAQLGTLTEVTNDSKGAAGPGWKFLSNSRTLPFVENEQSQPPQPLQIQIRCLRGLKAKAPPGYYVLKVSPLGRLGGCVLQWRQMEQLKTRTHPIRHNGNFYDVGLYFHENLYMVLPQKETVKPGMAFLFDLFLLRGTYSCPDRAVGWAVFPLCDNFDLVEGKFKCRLFRGHYDQKLSKFRKIEDLICLDLDSWLCNLYFQVIKLPLHFDGQKNDESNT
nr:uncharacterized protein LOC100406559 isoform X4 [Callithrix jacchus]